MIIFSTIKDIPEEYLTMKGIKSLVRYNLTSYYNDCPTLNKLIPSVATMPEESIDGDAPSLPAFDIAYGQYIFGDNEAFMQLMNIIIPVYMNPDCLVQILISNSDFRDTITESLIKLIQQRYGYNVFIINTIEDFLYINELDFSIPGLFGLTEDLNRWRSLMPPQDWGDEYE